MAANTANARGKCERDLSKAPVVSLSKKLYPYCLVLVGSRNRVELDFTIELK